MLLPQGRMLPLRMALPPIFLATGCHPASGKEKLQGITRGNIDTPDAPKQGGKVMPNAYTPSLFILEL